MEKGTIEVHAGAQAKLGVMLRVLMAILLAVTLIPISRAYAAPTEGVSESEPLGLKIITPETTQAEDTHGVIEGIVYVDANNNGKLDTGEAPVTDCVVTYGDPANESSVYDQVKTDAYGSFTFTDVPDGSYAVRVAPQIIDSRDYVTFNESSTDPIEEMVTLETPIVEAETVAEPEDEPDAEAEALADSGEALEDEDADDTSLEEPALLLQEGDSSTPLGGGPVVMAIGDPLVIDTDVYSINDTNLQTVLEGLYSPAEIAAATTLEFTGSGSIGLGVAWTESASCHFLNNLIIDKVDLSSFYGTLNSYAFCVASRITTVALGTTVSSLSEAIFYNCSSLSTISDTLANAQANPGIIDLEKTGVTTLDAGGYQFIGCSSIETVTLGSAIPSLPVQVFFGCSSLATISDTSVNAQGVSLGVIDLEKTGVSFLETGGAQFVNCASIVGVTLDSSIPSLPQHIFSNCSSLVNVSDTLANLQGVSSGFIDMDKVPMLEATGYQFSQDSLAVTYMGNNSHSLPKGTFAGTHALFVPKTNSLITADAGAFSGGETLYIKGPQATSPTTIANPGNIAPASLVYYYEVSATTDGNGTIAKAPSNFLDSAIIAREVLEGHLPSGSDYVEESANLVYTITPNIGCFVDTITATVDGTSTDITSMCTDNGDGTWTFPGVIDDTDFYVTFDGDYTVTYHLVDRAGTDISSGAFQPPAAETNKHVNDTFGTVTAPTGTNYIYAGWNTDNLGSTATTAITGTVTGNMDIYLVYGTDNGQTGDDDDTGPHSPDGLEDVVVSRHHIKATDGTALTGNLTPANKIQNLVDSPYTDAEAGVTETGWTYAGWNTTGSNTTYTAGPPSIALTAGTNVDVYYVYTQTAYTVTYHLVDRAGADIASGAFQPPATETNKHYNDTFGTVTAPTATNYIYVGWNTNNAGSTNTAAITGTVTGNMDIYLVYGADNGQTGDDADVVNTPDGLEDVVISRHHIKATDGSALTGTLTPINKVQNLVDSPYTDAHGGVVELGWTYAGWNTTGSNTTYTAGTPSIALTAGTNVDVYYVYTQNAYTVTYHLVDRSGTDIATGAFQPPTAETNKHINDTFGTVTAPIATNYIYTGWNTDNAGSTNTAAITGTVTGNMDIYLVYGADNGQTGDDDDTGPHTPDGLEDVVVSRHHIKATDGTSLTGNLTPANKIQNLVDSPYTDAEAGVTETGWTYAGWNTTGSNTTYTAGTPSIALTAGINVDVYYVYTQTAYTVTYHLVDRAGTDIAAGVFQPPATETNKHYSDTFGTVTAPTAANYIYAGWNTDNLGSTATTAITGTVTGNMDIYLVYGADNGQTGDDDDTGPHTPDGLEDVVISRHHIKATDGTALTGNLTPANKIQNLVDSPYTDAEAGVTETGWTYAGWNTTGSNTTYTAGTPSIALTAGINVDVYYVYTQTTYTVTYHLVDRAGTDIAAGVFQPPVTETNKHINDTFGTVTAPSVTNYIYVGWNTDNLGSTATTAITGTVTGNMDIYLVYGADNGDTGDDADVVNPPDGLEDVVISRHHIKATDGSALTGTLAPINKIQNLVDSPYTDAHGGVVETGWTYAGWNITGSNTTYTAGTPSITLLVGVDVDVYYVYT